MAKKNKALKSKLSPFQIREGKIHIYILLGMIVIGLVIAAYNMN
jgi:hypothetical protein